MDHLPFFYTVVRREWIRYYVPPKWLSMHGWMDVLECMHACLSLLDGYASVHQNINIYLALLHSIYDFDFISSCIAAPGTWKCLNQSHSSGLYIQQSMHTKESGTMKHIDFDSCLNATSNWDCFQAKHNRNKTIRGTQTKVTNRQRFREFFATGTEIKRTKSLSSSDVRSQQILNANSWRVCDIHNCKNETMSANFKVQSLQDDKQAKRKNS
jgi:hypothetical protein